MTDSIAYLTCSVVSDAPEGMFARVLRHEPPGRRYVEPPKPDKPGRRSMPLTMATGPAKDPGKRGPKKPRWTTERVEQLPKTYGFLTRTGFSEAHASGNEAVIYCRCDGGSPHCRGTIVVPARVFGKHQRSCKPCSSFNKKPMPAFTPKGYAHARDHVANTSPRASVRAATRR